MINSSLPVIAVIATTPRVDNLLRYALPSLRQQTHLPEALVIVSDQRALANEEKQRICRSLSSLPIIFLTNQNRIGAAGSWNTAIKYIDQFWKNSYVAILDDDDCWHVNHVATCLTHSRNGKADLVLSGINVVINSRVVASNIPVDLVANDFLASNPGWQGSNTFIKLSVLNRVDGFTNGLVSSNDRDLAIRVLDLPGLQISYTKQATVNWQCNHSASALSAPGSPQKLYGSAQFYRRYQHRMSKQIEIKFFQRLETLFNINRTQLLQAVTELEK